MSESCFYLQDFVMVLPLGFNHSQGKRIQFVKRNLKRIGKTISYYLRIIYVLSMVDRFSLVFCLDTFVSFLMSNNDCNSALKQLNIDM